MPLAKGQSLSFYEVLGPLGAGGMGEVYLARDTRLDREVAIKVLPEVLAGDEERLRRFDREAKTLASLNPTPPHTWSFADLDKAHKTKGKPHEASPDAAETPRTRPGAPGPKGHVLGCPCPRFLGSGSIFTSLVVGK